MINLIPNKEKKEMVKSFYFRLLVLFLVIASVSLLIAFVAILPSYFLSSAKNRIVNEKLEIQKKEPMSLPQEETLAVIKDLNNKLTLIEKAEDNKFTISQKVVNAIIISRGKRVAGRSIET